MKKYIFKTVLCSALALSLTTSCELDQYPESHIPAEKAWQKVSDAQKFYIGLLAELRGNTASSSRAVTERQADLFNIMKGAGDMRTHDWTFTTSQFPGDANWTSNYSLITSANNILDNIDQVTIENKEEQAIIDNIKGAAYFSRALAYSNMAPRYCVNYDAETAETALGLPLVEAVDVNAKPARASLKATYDLILSDIENASKLIMGGQDYTAPNKDVVTALKARVCLNMKMYDEAIEAATSLFETYPLTTVDDYSTLWFEDAGTEIIFQPIMTPEERGGGFSSGYMGYNKAKEAYAPSYVPTQGLMDLYEDDDVRKETFFSEQSISTLDEVEDGYMFIKFPGNDALRQEGEDETNSWFNMCKAFRTSEMYLIAAEASLFKAERNEAAALGYLNALRAQRGIKALFSTGAALDKDLKNEWTREMVGEGFRLDNLKRWNDGVKRMAPQHFESNMLVNTPAKDYTELNVQPNSPLYYKMIWEIPSNDQQANSNLIPNWTKK